MAARLTRGRFTASIAALIVLLAVGLSACGGRAELPATPRAVMSAGPGVATSGAVAMTRAQLTRALGDVGLQLDDAQVPYRAPEPPSFDTVPRAIVRALLPDDPNHGYISIYEFPTTSAAADGGRALAGYLRTGFGRAQFPPDARQGIRQLGTTLIYFWWSPASSPDVRTADIEKALELVGSKVEIPG